MTKFNIKKLDIVLLFIFIGILIVSALRLCKGQEKKYLEVTTPKGEYIYELSSDRIIDAEGPEGVSKIEIKDGKARFLDSPCPNKTCVETGWIEESDEWAACLPNRIFIRISGGESGSFDASTF